MHLAGATVPTNHLPEILGSSFSLEQSKASSAHQSLASGLNLHPSKILWAVWRLCPCPTCSAVLPLPWQVDVQFVRMTKRFIPLSEIKAHHLAHKADGGPLKDMMLFSRQRLSIQPLTQGENLPGLLIPSVRQAGSFTYGFFLPYYRGI